MRESTSRKYASGSTSFSLAVPILVLPTSSQ